MTMAKSIGGTPCAGGGSSPCGLEEPGALLSETRMTVIMVSTILFAACFMVAWVVIERHPVLSKKSLVIRADLAARVHSTIHSFIIVPGLLYGLFTIEWGPNFEPHSSVAAAQTFLLVSVAYFLFDLVVTVGFRLPQWPVYALHHVAAVTPYVIYLFVPVCPYGLFILSAFLLVEATNVPLNVRAFLEQLGRGSSPLYVAMLYVTIVGWVIVRIANPLYLLYVIHRYVWPSVPLKSCMAFSIVCAYFIAVFCIGVFFHVLLPEVVNRWRAAPVPTDIVEDPATGKTLHVNPDVPLTPDELELTAQSPTRIVLYEAREKAFQLEHALDQQRSSSGSRAAESVRLRRPTSAMSASDSAVSSQ